MSKIIFSIALGLLFSFNVSAKDYLVKQKSGYLTSLSNTYGIQVLDRHDVAGLVKISVDPNYELPILLNLMSSPNVEYVVENFKLHAVETNYTPWVNLKAQWSIKKVNAEKAWEMAGNQGSKNILVAVIDTGTDYRHESLSPNMVPGYDFAGNDNDPMDETGQNPGHGTHCAGIVGATGLVEGGIIGLSPNISMMPLRFLDANGSGDLMNGIKAIDYAIEKKARVISASWGATVSRSQAQALVDAVKRADDAGIIFVVAAANDGRNNDTTEVYPANAGFPNTISVAASGPNDEKPSWSNYGKASVHVAAPGLDIMSTLPKNKYGNLSGTSMATPLVSGLVALLLSQDDTLTGAEVRALLQTTGASAKIDTACNCRVDAAAAMDVVLNKKMFITPAALTIKPNETQQFHVKNGVGSITYTSSAPTVAEISNDGTLKAIAKGETTVTATDSSGKSVTSLTVRVVEGSGGGDNPTPNPTPTDCPFEDPQTCELLCQIQPSLPWCNQ